MHIILLKKCQQLTGHLGAITTTMINLFQKYLI